MKSFYLSIALSAVLFAAGVALASACPLYPTDENCERMERIEENQRNIQMEMDRIQLQQSFNEMDAMRARSRY